MPDKVTAQAQHGESAASATANKGFAPITVKPMIAATVPGEQKRPYWIGVFKDAPVHNLVAGGVTFHEHVDVPSPTSKIMVPGGPGNVVWLSERQVALVCDAAGRIVFRRAPGGWSKHDTGDPRYRQQAGDEPAAKYMWMIPLDPDNVEIRPSKPVPMLSAG